MRCIDCGGKIFEETVNYKMVFSNYPNDFIAPLIINKCRKCGEEFTTCKDLQKWEILISDQIIKAQNYTKDMYKFVRKAYGISKKDISTSDIVELRKSFTKNSVHILKWLLENKKNIGEIGD